MSLKNHIIFSGQMWTSYSQMYIESGEYTGGLATQDAFRGQTNGLFGGAVSGGAFLRTGVETGDLCIKVELHDVAPPVDESWEEIVEASFSVNPPPIFLLGWDGTSNFKLPLSQGEYRARFCAKGYGQSEALSIFGDSSIENYCLILWRESRRPDTVIKETSDLARSNHQWARTIT